MSSRVMSTEEIFYEIDRLKKKKAQRNPGLQIMKIKF